MVGLRLHGLEVLTSDGSWNVWLVCRGVWFGRNDNNVLTFIIALYSQELIAFDYYSVTGHLR